MAMSQMKPVLIVEGLGRNYGEKVALVDLSFSVAPGEIVGLLGPNGAGKTTAMRLLTTILTPTAGRFSVLGIPHEQREAIRAQIGMLPESNGYPAGSTGLGFLTYMGELYGLSRRHARERAARLLKDFGLELTMTDRIGTYSRGMRQRLGMARALINDPPLLFLDEPTLGFDPIGQREMLGYIQNRAADQGTAIIISSHLLEVIEEVCGRVIVLNEGRTVASNTIAKLRQRESVNMAFQLWVAADAAGAALTLLNGLTAVEIAVAGESSGEIDLTIWSAGLTPNINEILGALIAAGIPLLGIAEKSRRLSDAFHTMISEVQ